MQKRCVLSLIASSPSSLYSPKFSLPLNLDTLSRRYKPTSPQILAPSKLPLLRQIMYVSFLYPTQEITIETNLFGTYFLEVIFNLDLVTGKIYSPLGNLATNRFISTQNLTIH